MDPVVAAAITLTGVVLASWLTYRASTKKQRSDSGMQLVDQLQEDMKELRTESGVQRSRIDKLEKVARVQGDYIGELRRHIADGRPPPPPPYPSGLIT